MPERCLSFSTGLIKYEHAIYVYDTQHCGQRMSAQARPRLITLNTSNKTKYLFPPMHAGCYYNEDRGEYSKDLHVFQCSIFACYKDIEQEFASFMFLQTLG